ncbi:MAG: 2-succinyl-5-enolpyruvyl-6-hydroxy-3-cyclohexene-1-carboxylic-acid synthase [Chromatiaceae bacterium]|nr:2-succinyl-5-enolpyruvyl-6-hydroxy-3-cyclohexene-1-carboxylic-acid synthase [Chromatiaceae bacterium]
MSDIACRNLRWALALLDGFLEGGVRELVLSPGSRSTPLVLAGQRRPALRLRPVLDERAAAFLALGLARASHHPVALLATSGSAPAHWYPAVIEASAADVPLILISADRPPELRDWGANQTIDQTRLFGTFVRAFHDPGTPEDSPAALRMMRALGRRAAEESLGRRPGPVHINLPLREPLVPDSDCLAPQMLPDLARPLFQPEPPTLKAPPAVPAHLLAPIAQAERALRPLPAPSPAPPALAACLREGRGLICCGPEQYPEGFAEALWEVAEALGLPVLCDPLSGLRCGPGSRARITHYDNLLRNPEAAQALRPDWVLRLGRVPVSKTLLGWLAGIPSVLVDPGGRWSDPNQDARLRLDADPLSLCRWLAALAPEHAPRPAGGWLATWHAAEERLATLSARYLAEAPWCEPHLIRTLLARLPEGDGLLCANSLPIRQFDAWSGSREARLHLFGNRGVSGIDGQNATLAGLNAGGVPTTGLLGDLSTLHDVGSLGLLQGIPRPLIVINNGGGRIFDELPQRGLPDFERLWRTPQGRDLGALARAFELSHRTVEDEAGLVAALEAALAEGARAEGAGLIEVRIDAEQSSALHRDFRAHLADARLLD